MYAKIFLAARNASICTVLPSFVKFALWSTNFYIIFFSSKRNSCSYRAERMATWCNGKLFPLSIRLIFFIDTPLWLAASERVNFFSVLNKRNSRPIIRLIKKILSAVFLVGFIFSSLFFLVIKIPALKLGRRSSKTVTIQSPLFNILPALRLFQRRTLL